LSTSFINNFIKFSMTILNKDISQLK